MLRVFFVISTNFKQKIMSTKSLLVDQNFPQNMNCAQTVFYLHADELGIEKDTALKLASGFGGGMACAETCGAITGAYMVIGMKHGHTSSDPEDKMATKQKIMQFNESFIQKHGSLICKKLVGFAITDPEEMEAAREAEVFTKLCPGFIKSACDILEEAF